MSPDRNLDKLLWRAWTDVAYGPVPEDLRASFASALMDAGWRSRPLPDPVPIEWTLALRRICTEYNRRGLLTAEAAFEPFIERLAVWVIECR